MLLRRLVPLLSCALAFQLPLQRTFSTCSPRPLLSDGFDAFAQDLLREWGVPGLALGVVKLDKKEQTRVEFRSYGDAGRGRKVDEDAFTAAAVGQVLEQKGLSWKDKVHRLVPEFELKQECPTGQVTLLDLLSHRTGLPRHEHSYRVGQTPVDLVENLKHLNLSAELRETFQYSNQPFVVAAHLISSLTGEPFTSFVTSHIFKPLNMTSSTYSPHLDGPATLAHFSSSFSTLENKSFVEIPFSFDLAREDLEFNAGAGGIVSSTRDMVKWVELLIRQHRRAVNGSEESRPEDSILSPATVLQLTTPHMLSERRPPPPLSAPVTYGMGFFLQHSNDTEFIYHGGDIPGFGSQVGWSPAAGVGSVALTNADGSGNTVANLATSRAFDELLKLDPADWSVGFREEAEKAKQERAEASFKASQHAPSISSSLPSDAYLGSYSAPGYGVVHVCSPSPTSAFSRLSSSASACSALHDRLADSTPISSVPPSSPGPALLIDWRGFFGASHVLLRHFDGEVWKGAFASVYEGTESSPGRKVQYEKADSVRVRFVLDEEGKRVEGFEVSGVWGAGAEVEKDEERVEVFFQRQ
ncbi:hypothetical protein JCM6882_007739 [Rhodosporidiobolus microsporus]